MLRVIDLHAAAEAPSVVKIDSYVPISFRSRSQPIAGARYIRLGDFKTQLLELQFPAESLTLSGFTLVSGKGTAQGTLMGDGPSSSGLPVIELPSGAAFSEGGKVPRIDIQIDVTVSCTDRQAEIRFGPAESFNRKILHERVQFLLSDDVLVGLRVLDLTEKEGRILRDYITEHPPQR